MMRQGSPIRTARMISHDTIVAIAAEVDGALGVDRTVEPFSYRYPEFDVDAAYRVLAELRRLRERRGEVAIGRKIGFTNRLMWAEYGVHSPIWGYMFRHTAHDLAEIGGFFPLSGLSEPRIEPEIVLRLRAAPTPDLDEVALIDCIDWVAHGFEIVQSIFPNWKFAAPDTIAANGLHGALAVGPRQPVAGKREEWLRSFGTFEIELLREGAQADRGRGDNVLGGPLSALRHLVRLLAHDKTNPPLAAGEIVTTGSLTRALPILPGERWATELSGIPLVGISIAFEDKR